MNRTRSITCSSIRELLNSLRSNLPAWSSEKGSNNFIYLKLILIILILLIISTCQIYKKPGEYHSYMLPSEEELMKKEWFVLPGNFYSCFDPLLLWHFLSDQTVHCSYSEVLYRNTNGKLEKWVTLRTIVDEEKACYSPEILWTDNGYLYISACTGRVEAYDPQNYSRAEITIYKVNIKKKELKAKKSFKCLSSEYALGPAILYEKQYALLKDKGKIILIYPQYLWNEGINVISIKADLSEKINCCFIDEGFRNVDRNIPLRYKIENNYLYLRWKNEEGKLFEASVYLDDLEKGKCSVR